MKEKPAIELNGGFNLFNHYLLENKHQASDTLSNGYYPVNVVAEAYSQGFSDGKDTATKELIDKLIKNSTERFIEKANQVYLCTKSILSSIRREQYAVTAFYINIFHQNPKVIIAVPNKQLLNDEFITLAYTKIHEVKCSFSSLFNSTLDMGIVGSDNLDYKMLEKDGFEYSEKVDVE